MEDIENLPMNKHRVKPCSERTPEKVQGNPLVVCNHQSGLAQNYTALEACAASDKALVTGLSGRVDSPKAPSLLMSDVSLLR